MPTTGCVTVTLKSGPRSCGDRVVVTGTLTLDNAYASGGNILKPEQLGLSTVEDLFLFLPRNAGGTAVTSLVLPVVRTVLPVRTGLFAGTTVVIYIQLFTDASGTEPTGDASGYVIPFEAWGT
jgi:hypothetical protein